MNHLSRSLSAFCILLIALLVSQFIGCAAPESEGVGGGSATYGSACQAGVGCAEGLLCVTIDPLVGDVCTQECSSDADCPEGSPCLSDLSGLTSHCSPAVIDDGVLSNGIIGGNGTTSGETSNGTSATSNGTSATSNGTTSEGCTGNEGCPSGLICADGACVSGCRSDLECGAGQTCDPETSQCVDSSMEGCQADTFEGNNSQATATRLDAGEYEGLGICPGDVDYLAVELAVGARLLADITFTHDDGNINAQLLNPRGEVLGRSSGITNSETLQRTIDEPGVYYILIEGATAAVENSYNLSLSKGAGPGDCQADPFEPNNSSDQAALISSGTHSLFACPGEDDWFQIFAETGAEIAITATFNGDLGNIDLLLFDTNQRPLADSTGFGNQEAINYVATGTGDVLLNVASEVAQGQSGYTLSISVDGVNVGGGDCDDSYEPNNSVALAASLGEGSYPDLSLCVDDEADFFAVTLADNQILTVSITFSSALGDIDLELLGSDGFTSLDDSLGVGNSESVSYAATVAGVYYVYAYILEDGPNTYDMTLTIEDGPDTGGSCTDAYEPNDSDAEAAPLGAGSYPDLSLCGGVDDDDFFAVELGLGETLSVDLSFDGDVGDLDLQLIDLDGLFVLERSLGVGDSESVSHQATEAGTYYVRVYTFDDSVSAYAMTIVIDDATAGGCVDALEPNNSVAAAAAVRSGTYGDLTLCASVNTNDYYSIFLDQGADITVTLVGSGAGDLDLSLIGPNGTTILDSSTSIADNESVSHTTTTAGTYTIRAYHYGGDPNTYTLTVDAEEPNLECTDDGNEEDDDPASAQQVGMGAHAGQGCAQDADFFEVSIDAGQIFTAALTTTANLEVAILDEDGTTVLASSVSGATQIAVSFEAAQRAYVRVVPRGLGSGAYTLTLSQSAIPTETPCVDRFEPNNDGATATPIQPGTFLGLDVCAEDEFDFFAITLDANDTIDVTILFTDSIADLDLYFLNSDGDLLDGSSTTTNNESLGGTVLLGGTYFISVEHYEGERNLYDLIVTVSP